MTAFDLEKALIHIQVLALSKGSINKPSREWGVHYKLIATTKTRVTSAKFRWKSELKYYKITSKTQKKFVLTLYHTIPTFNHPEKEAF